MPVTVITPEIATYIRENYLKFSSTDIAEKFDVSKSAVLRFRKKNKLIVSIEVTNEFKRIKSYVHLTEADLKYIKENIATKSIKQVAKDIGRCPIKTAKAAKELGFAEVIKQKAKDSHFQKGNISPTSGKNISEFMSAETIAKFKANQFKKNSIPHNALDVGEERIVTHKKTKKSYYMIKLEGERKLIYKHTHVWETTNGKVPKGFVVVFKDSDTFNCVIDNLECISRAELMSRNTIQRYPKELKSQIRKLATLNNLINKAKKK